MVYTCGLNCYLFTFDFFVIVLTHNLLTISITSVYSQLNWELFVKYCRSVKKKKALKSVDLGVYCRVLVSMTQKEKAFGGNM